VTDSSPAQSAALTDTSAHIDLADPTAVSIASVTQLSAIPSNATLNISWAKVNLANGYYVSYATSENPGIELAAFDVTNTGIKLTGLENGTEYVLTVHAYYQASYHFAVRAKPGNNQNLLSEITEEKTVTVGPRVNGATAKLNATPDKITTFPNLPDEGCFIATAAFDYYSAPQVQVLRDFRDRYLLKFALGKRWVQWYYLHSPKWAAAIKEQPALKKAVRVLLYPIIALAYFLVELSWLQMAVWVFFLLSLGYLFYFFIRVVKVQIR
jgi:hypothetical protein